MHRPDGAQHAWPWIALCLFLTPGLKQFLQDISSVLPLGKLRPPSDLVCSQSDTQTSMDTRLLLYILWRALRGDVLVALEHKKHFSMGYLHCSWFRLR